MAWLTAWYGRYDKLKEDFKFNLGLIEDRDAELGRYEAAIQSLKECLRDKARKTLDATIYHHKQQ